VRGGDRREDPGGKREREREREVKFSDKLIDWYRGHDVVNFSLNFSMGCVASRFAENRYFFEALSKIDDLCV